MTCGGVPRGDVDGVTADVVTSATVAVAVPDDAD